MIKQFYIKEYLKERLLIVFDRKHKYFNPKKKNTKSSFMGNGTISRILQGEVDA